MSSKLLQFIYFVWKVLISVLSITIYNIVLYEMNWRFNIISYQLLRFKFNRIAKVYVYSITISLFSTTISLLSLVEYVKGFYINYIYIFPPARRRCQLLVFNKSENILYLDYEIRFIQINIHIYRLIINEYIWTIYHVLTCY